MAFDVQGKLHEVFSEMQVSEKFRKREFVLEVQDGLYQQFIKFQLTQDRCALLNDYSKGDDVKVSFNLTGRPATSKTGDTVYYTNLVAWRIDRNDTKSSDVPEMRQNPISEIDEVPF